MLPWLSSSIRRWPSDSLLLQARPGPSAIVSSSMPVEQAVGLGPRLLGGVAGDGVHPDAEADLAALVGGELADPLDLLGDGGRRLAPGEVDVGVLGGDLARPPATSRRSRSRGPGRGSAAARASSTWRCSPWKSTVSPAHSAADDRQELVAPRVAGVLVQEVAVRPLLVALAAGDDVEQQPAAGQVLEGAGHLRGQRRRGQARAGTRPGTSAAPRRWLSIAVDSQASSHQAPVGRQRGLEAELLGAAGDLAEVGHAAGRPDGAGVDAVAAADDLAAVAAVGGQEPVELQRGGQSFRRPPSTPWLVCLLRC